MPQKSIASFFSKKKTTDKKDVEEEPKKPVNESDSPIKLNRKVNKKRIVDDSSDEETSHVENKENGQKRESNVDKDHVTNELKKVNENESKTNMPPKRKTARKPV